jgi:dihydrofolate reductase
MRLVHYGGAMSLDGYIAGPGGEHDWIAMDPDVDFAEMIGRFDTFLLGRNTFEGMRRAGRAAPMPGLRYVVCSRTMPETDAAAIDVSRDADATVAALRSQPGKDIAIFGGGILFRSLLEADLVDRVEASIVPVLLGGGVPFLPSPSSRRHLKLLSHRVYPKTGTVRLQYEVLKR